MLCFAMVKTFRLLKVTITVKFFLNTEKEYLIKILFFGTRSLPAFLDDI